MFRWVRETEIKKKDWICEWKNKDCKIVFDREREREREKERERERENVTVSKWHVQKVGILKFLKVADIHAVR